MASKYVIISLFFQGIVLLFVNSAYGVDTSLLIHYNFNSAPGSVADDQTAYQNDGTIVDYINTAYYSNLDGREGVLRLDGVDSYISIPYDSELDFQGDLSFEMWVKYHDSMPEQWGHIFGDTTGSDFIFYKVYYWSHLLYYQYETNMYGIEDQVVTTDPNFIDDSWAHIAVVVEYPRCRFYKNGILARDAYMPIPGILQNGNHNLAIGIDCPMDLDDFRLYDRALPASEVAQHAAGNYPNPMSDDEVFVEPNWYEDIVTLRLSSKGFNYYGYTAELKLVEGTTTVAGPVNVSITKAFNDSERYEASHSFSISGLEGKALDGIIRIYDAGFNFVKQVTKTDVSIVKPDWIDTAEGYSNQVLPPWTPLQANFNGDIDIDIWGRQYTVGNTPFFNNIVTNSSGIFVEPMRLNAKVNSSDITWNPASISLINSSDLKAQLDQTFSSVNGKLSVQIDAVTEYDGYTIFDLTLQANQSFTLNELNIEIPLKTAHAGLCYGDNVYPWVGPVYMDAYYSGAVTEDLAFLFSPTVWLGSETAGLCWQSESNEDWINSNPQNAIEILPQPDGITTIFRANLVDMNTVLNGGQQLHYKFALLATPVKPVVREAWDLNIAASEPKGKELELPETTINDVPGGTPALEHYAQAGLGHLYIHIHDLWPYPMPTAPAFSSALSNLIDTAHSYGLKIYSYQIHQRFPTGAPEFDIYGDNMSKRRMRQYIPTTDRPDSARPGAVAHNYGAYSQGTSFGCPKSKAYQDAYISSLAKRLDTYGDDGVYLDGTSHTPPCKNPAHNCGYITGPDSRNETYPVFASREFMKRIYTVVKQRDPNGIVDAHCSWGYSPATLAYADVMWTGEQWSHLAGTGASYVHGELPLDMFRTEFMGFHSGTAAETLHYRLGDKMKVMATSLLHDIPCRAYSHPETGVAIWNMHQDIWQMREDYNADNAEKYFYWQDNQADVVTVSPNKAYTLIMKHPVNGVLVLVSNLHSNLETVTIELNLDNLDLAGKSLSAENAITGSPVTITNEGIISQTMASEAWMYILITGSVQEPACGDENHPYPPGDINKDCYVDFSDIASIASDWLKCTDKNPPCSFPNPLQLSSADFSLGYGYSGYKSWNTSETESFNTPTAQGDFTFYATLASGNLSNTGPGFPGRVLTDNAGFTGWVGNLSGGIMDQFRAVVTASYQGAHPVDAAALPNYRLMIEITSISIYCGVLEDSSVKSLWWDEITPGHLQSSSPISPVQVSDWTEASNYEQLIWNPPDFKIALTGINEQAERTFDIKSFGWGDLRMIDGFEIEGRVHLFYDAEQ